MQAWNDMDGELTCDTGTPLLLLQHTFKMKHMLLATAGFYFHRLCLSLRGILLVRKVRGSIPSSHVHQCFQRIVMSMVTHMHQNRSIILEQEEVYYCILACYYL